MSRTPILFAVYLPTTLLALGQGLLLATLPLYADDFGVSYRLVSLAVAAAAIGTLATDVPAGAVLGRLGLRETMIGGAALVAASTLALAWSRNLSDVIVLRLVAGVGTALWGLSRHAYIAEAVPIATRGRTISVFGGINRIGVFGGPAIGGIVGDRLGLEASFVLAGIASSLALLVSLLYLDPVPNPTPRPAFAARWRVVGRLIRANGRDLAAASVAQTFAQMIRAGRHFIIPIYGANALGLDAAEVGLIMTVASIVDVAMFFPAGVLMDRFGRKVAAVPSFAVMAVGVALIPFATTSTGLMLAAVVVGFGNGLGSGTMMTLGADLAPAGATGEFLGLWRLVGDAGAVGGPLAVGVMASGLGLEESAFALAGVGVAAALTLAFLVRETRTSPLDAVP
jgi:MFS family permease